jgi:subtilase family serine protease
VDEWQSGFAGRVQALQFDGEMLRKLNKVFSAAALLSLGAASMGQNYFVPPSSQPHTFRGGRACQTDYLIYTGSSAHRRSVGPLADSFGLLTGVAGYHPSDILSAYNIPVNEGTQAIAVVDAFDLPTNLNDFNVFSKEFGLPEETSTDPTLSSNQVLQVVYPQGSRPPANSSWDGEIALDMEWAHAIAPNAKIYLVECASDAVADLLEGAQFAAQQLPGVSVVSMSFGTTEYAGETQFDTIFKQPNVMFLAAAGDTPNVPTYPATSPNVISVGGTSLGYANGTVESESYWFENKTAGGSAGPSTIEPRPVYQNPYASIIGSFKGNPDVAADGDPSTGCSVYVSTEIVGAGNQPVSGWLVIGGTSLACPIVAGILDDRGNFPASSSAELSLLYSLAGTGSFRDIVSGSSGKYSARVGYDLCTGLGVPIGVTTTHNLAFSSGSLVSGVAILGVPDNMKLKDDHLYEVRSSPSGSNTMATVGAVMTGTVPGSSAEGGSVTVTGLSTAQTTQVLALNVSTNHFDVLGTLPLTYTLSTVSLSIPNIANYLSASGSILLQISGVNTGSTTQSRLGVDQVAVQVAGPIQ